MNGARAFNSGRALIRPRRHRLYDGQMLSPRLRDDLALAPDPYRGGGSWRDFAATRRMIFLIPWAASPSIGPILTCVKFW